MTDGARSAAEACERLHIDVQMDERGRCLATPKSVQLAAQLIESLSGSRGPSAVRLAPIGSGSSFDWCRPDQGAETLRMATSGLITGGSSGIIEYVPGDGVITAQGGTSLATLKDAVREGGHRLTPAIAGEATLGGVLASGRSGPDRLGYGPLRHHVLGMHVIDGGGRVARSGGRLVKNVTGFDLHRVHVGARGSLGVILEASMRLMPIPEAELVVRSRKLASATEAVDAALAIRAQRVLQPRLLCVVGTEVVVGLAGRELQVVREREALADLIDVGSEQHGSEATEAVVREAEAGGALRVSTRPSRCRRIVRALEAAGFDPASLRAQPAAAQVELTGAAIEENEAAFLESVVPIIRETESDLMIRGRVPAAVRGFARQLETLDGPRREWTDRLYAAFDPHGLLRIPEEPHFSA